MTRTLAVSGALLCMTFGAFADPIPAGTRIDVRSDQTIDVRDTLHEGRVYTATVANDVLNGNGRVHIPRGSRAELVVRRLGPNELSIDLDSVTVRGERYTIDSQATSRTRRDGVGGNQRTGQFVGGGALFGTILGAIAGGGKGAAIGALAGAAAGAGAQVLTRGEKVHIPAESILSFRLDRPLQIYRRR